MTLPFSKIVAFGCSYTAGDELLDAEVLQSLGDEDEVDRIKRSYSNFRIMEFREKYYNKKYVDQKWLKQNGEFDWGLKVNSERKLSWVKQLSDIYQVDFINHGLGGASIEYCIYRYEENLIKGNINDDDLLIFCIPSPLRFFYIDMEKEPRRCLLNFPVGWPDDQFYNSITKHLGNSSYNFWNYYKHIKYIELLNQQRGNVFAFFSNIDQRNLKAHYIDDIRGSIVDKMVDEITNFSCLLLPDTNFLPLPGEVTHGFGHNKIERHKEIAGELAVLIDRKIL